MRIRAHLLLLTLASLVPMVIFGIVATSLIAKRERVVFRQGAIDRTLALLTAVDTELLGQITNLQALASSRNLESGDLQAFWTDAVRVLRTQPRWESIHLALPSGRRLLDASHDFGAELAPIQDDPSFDEVLRTAKPMIGDLFLDNGKYFFPIRVPVQGEAGLQYVLSVRVSPDSIVSLLAPQRLPEDWVAVVLDAKRRVVARTLDQTRSVGELASEDLRAELERTPEGWFRSSSRKGSEVYTPYNRSPFSNWTVAMAIPAATVELGSLATAGIFALGLLATIAIALVFAFALSRRIATPIATLASMADSLASGAPVTPPRRAHVQEVHEVSRALVQAAHTVREREQALRNADRAKDEFLAMLGHELRNPLSALASAATVLQMSGLPDGPAIIARDIIGRQIQHMARLIDDLLDVGRLTTGKIKLCREPLDLGEVVRNSLRALRTAGRLSQHEVRVDAASVTIDADEARVEQIVTNLVGNALKYTPPGGTIDVHVYRQGRDAVLEVVDTGAGMSAELLPRVFDLFVQGERSLDRSLGGLGIGLTLVKRLTELHGGTTAASSDGAGRGARFVVRLPASDAIRVGGGGEAKEEVTPHALRRILVIEDNHDARQTLLVALALYGHDVFEAADGPSGVLAAARVRPEVAIIDIGLPGLDGYEVARRLRSSPEGRSMLLIALTGYGQSEARKRALEAGFDAFLTKPVAPDELVERIELGFAKDKPAQV